MQSMGRGCSEQVLARKKAGDDRDGLLPAHPDPRSADSGTIPAGSPVQRLRILPACQFSQYFAKDRTREGKFAKLRWEWRRGGGSGPSNSTLYQSHSSPHWTWSMPSLIPVHNITDQLGTGTASGAYFGDADHLPGIRGVAGRIQLKMAAAMKSEDI